MVYQRPNGYDFRAADDRDAPQIAALFQETYGDSSHPCRNVDFVRESMRRDVWGVVLEGERLAGCHAVMWHDWHRIYERCYCVIRAEDREQGLARHLMDLLLEATFAQPNCDLVIGYPRSRAIISLLQQEKDPPFVFTGHDGGVNIAHGVREYHLLGFSANPYRPPARLAPMGETAYASDFVNETIFSQLAFVSGVGSYPSRPIVGPVSPDHASTGEWRMGYAYEASCASLHIQDLSGPRRDAPGVIEGLMACLQVAPEVEHVYAYVLYDKVDVVLGLQDLGFQVSAFLPGWYWEQNRRYDCLLVTRCTSPEPPVANNTAALVELFTAGLNGGLDER